MWTRLPLATGPNEILSMTEIEKLHYNNFYYQIFFVRLFPGDL